MKIIRIWDNPRLASLLFACGGLWMLSLKYSLKYYLNVGDNLKNYILIHCHFITWNMFLITYKPVGSPGLMGLLGQILAYVTQIQYFCPSSNPIQLFTAFWAAGFQSFQWPKKIWFKPLSYVVLTQILIQ